MSALPRASWILVLTGGAALVGAYGDAGSDRRLADVGSTPTVLRAEPDASGQATWWFPPGAEAYDVPVAGGVRVRVDDAPLMAWLRDQSPLHLLELPALGARYGERTLVVIAPWPHYAEVVVEAAPETAGATRVGVRIRFPEGRRDATPCEIVARWRGPDELAVARAFREWRASGPRGAVPPPKTLLEHARDNPRVKRLIGAVHLYTWGPALFCRLDADREQWVPFAEDVLAAGPDTPARPWRARLGEDDRRPFEALAAADWPGDYLTRDAAQLIDERLRDRAWLGQPEGRPLAEMIEANRQALFEAFPGRLHPPATWGDGLSTSLLRAIHDAGIERALILAADLWPDAPRPDTARLADELGYLFGRYDSYHSVHDPTAAPDDTWATAQFDEAAYREGGVLRADGSGHGGFKGRGFHLSPIAARPYVEERVDRMMRNAPHTAWFVDCDAAYEYFDDFHPRHTATRVDDLQARRNRLRWMTERHGLVVGSEGGSALFSDVIRFGHGVDTPYIGHLDDPVRRDGRGRVGDRQLPRPPLGGTASPLGDRHRRRRGWDVATRARLDDDSGLTLESPFRPRARAILRQHGRPHVALAVVVDLVLEHAPQARPEILSRSSPRYRRTGCTPGRAVAADTLLNPGTPGATSPSDHCGARGRGGGAGALRKRRRSIQPSPSLAQRSVTT